MKIQKSITALIIFLYIGVVYFSPPSYINKPKFLFLTIVRFPLTLTGKVFSNLNYILHSKGLIEENISLRKRIDTLSNELTQYKETEAENKRLKSLLDFKKASPLKLVAARVIGKDSSNLSDTILIKHSASSGIKENTVVIAEAGLAGRVISSSSGMSRAMLITDPSSRISAIISRTRQLGMVYGTSARLCKLNYLPLDSDVMPGDEVVTSGFSDIYPKGLVIGKIIRVMKEPRGLSLFALIEPAVDIPKLEEVLCIE